MINRWKKYLLLTGVPPYINSLDKLNFLTLFLKSFFSKSYSKLLLVDNKNINKYLLPLPSVNAILSLAEANSLYKAAFFTKSRGDIIEIGTWRGGSVLILASGVIDSKRRRVVHGIDPFNESRDEISMKFLKSDIKTLGLKDTKENYYYVQKLLFKFKLEKNIKIHKSTSSSVAKNWKRKISFLFIDGNHEYGHVKKDFENWSNHVTREGLVALHDCKNLNDDIVGLPGPSRVATLIKNRSTSWKYLGQVESLVFFQKI